MTNEPLYDGDEDDAFDADDDAVDWSNVEQLAAEHDRILSIDDDDERLDAARRHVAELGGI